MRRILVGWAVFAFAAAVVQAPWAHVHVHGYDPDHERQHAGLDVLHGHGLDRPEPGLRWRAHDADEDARSLGPVTAVRVTALELDLTFDRTDPVANPPLIVVAWTAELSSRAHGPPTLGSVPPRAPPAQ